MFTNFANLDLESDTKLVFFKKLSIRDWLLLASFLSGALCVATGIILLLQDKQAVKANEQDSFQLIEATPTLFIDVSGAVVKPGIYQVQANARVAAVLEAAGGLNDFADKQYVAESLNLAKSLNDEEKIFIPFESTKFDESKAKEQPNQEQPKINAIYSDSLISINEASAAQLDELPKIGEVTAQKIISGRPYVTIQELISKKIISEGILKEIRELIKI